MHISIFFRIFAAVLTNQKEILQYLIGKNFFAPNHSRLASLLGQSGRMNIERLMTDKIGDRACNNLWNAICTNLNVPGELLPFLPDIYKLSDMLKATMDALPIETAPEMLSQPVDVEDDVWQQIISLYRQDPSLYYMLASITYAKRHGIRPYQQDMKGSEETVKAIDGRLHSLYPQQMNAHDAAQESLRTLDGMDADSWWWIGLFGGYILRLYHEPAYIDTMIEKLLFPMPFMEWQWWREAASNLPTDTLWFWQKNDSSGAVYDVMRVEDGQGPAQAVHFLLVFIGKGLLRLIQCEGENTRSTYLGWQMEQTGDICSLRFAAFDDNELGRLLPPELIMLMTTDDPALVRRAQEMTEAMPNEIAVRIYHEVGLMPTDEYTIEDIVCSRRIVKVLYRRKNCDNLQVARFALSEYPALRAVTVHSEVELFIGNNDNRLYAFWNSVGILVPMPS